MQALATAPGVVATPGMDGATSQKKQTQCCEKRR